MQKMLEPKSKQNYQVDGYHYQFRLLKAKKKKISQGHVKLIDTCILHSSKCLEETNQKQKRKNIFFL